MQVTNFPPHNCPIFLGYALTFFGWKYKPQISREAEWTCLRQHGRISCRRGSGWRGCRGPWGRQRGAAPDEEVPPAPLVLKLLKSGSSGWAQAAEPTCAQGAAAGPGLGSTSLGESQEYCLRSLIIFPRLPGVSWLGRVFAARGSLLHTDLWLLSLRF